MKLYRLLFDGERYFIEAETVARAVEIWKYHVAKEWGDQCDGTEEPEEIVLVHDEPVIRGVAP